MGEMPAKSFVEKLLYSRRDTADALSLSIRSVDYLITAGRLPTRRVGGKILIPASAVRRFAREDHPDLVRTVNTSKIAEVGRSSPDAVKSPFEPQSERFQDMVRLRANIGR
jgi:hypothetical protein